MAYSSAHLLFREAAMSGRLTILGLGPGDPGHITRKAWEALGQGGPLRFRTLQHPAVADLPPEWGRESFDHLYAELDDFEQIYRAIMDQVMQLARLPAGVTYAVPGDPSVGEATVQGLRRAAQEEDLALQILPGLSFIEPCLAALGLDALDGLSVADALGLASGHHPAFPPDQPALIGQLYSRELAAEVKLTLLNQYPPDHPVQLIWAAGSSSARLLELPLFELDRQPTIDSLTALCVPPLEQASSFEALQETIAHLRAPEGCPWDRQQTHLSLRPHLLEEAYEALHALDREDSDALREELGDLLLQIVLQTQIATEGGEFSMAEVIAGIQAKLIRRHPHVFGDLQVSEVDQVLRNWEHLKEEERGEQGAAGLLDGVPITLPALSQAAELQRRAAAVGFDWPDIQGVLRDVAEELQEFDQAGTQPERAHELGDMLFALVNVARWCEADPEAELRQANQRFRSRFRKMTDLATDRGVRLQDLSLDQMDQLWDLAKRQG